LLICFSGEGLFFLCARKNQRALGEPFGWFPQAPSNDQGLRPWTPLEGGVLVRRSSDLHPLRSCTSIVGRRLNMLSALTPASAFRLLGRLTALFTWVLLPHWIRSSGGGARVPPFAIVALLRHRSVAHWSSVRAFGLHWRPRALRPPCTPSSPKGRRPSGLPAYEVCRSFFLIISSAMFFASLNFPLIFEPAVV
jgi:hypothetical protein